MNSLILGNADDAHAKHLYTALTQAGAIAHYLDTYLFLTQLSLSWQPGTPTGSIR
ncbi:MAG: hypothetical protein WBB29_09960 [Geitlerinemataceae cyanobacterium]